MPPRIPLLTGTDPEAKRREILDYFHATYDLFEKLFEPFTSVEAFYQQPEPLRHPIIFYYGHTASFFINKLVLAQAIPERLHPVFESMFAIGVDEMTWDDLNEAHYEWPPVAEVTEYRNRVRRVVTDYVNSVEMTLPIDWDHPLWPVVMGIEHERIHIETSSVLHRQLPAEYVKPHPAWPVCPDAGEAPENRLLPVPGGLVTQGKPMGHKLYGWDNEYGVQTTEVKPFRASAFPVTNREWLAFMEEGGYLDPQWWTEEGESWRCGKKPEHPVFWVPDGRGGYRYRAMLEELPMPWDWPVDVNYLEAKAYCNWLSEKTDNALRLPTEAEWVRLTEHCRVPDLPEWGADAPGNINLEQYASSTPVTANPFGHGFHDVVGNVWQWTETPIYGFVGFKVHPLYDDFSVPTFDNRHNLIKGGSWISTGNEATLDSRYAFRRHFFQHAGFRYVEGEPVEEPEVKPNNDYETDAMLGQYCEFHYGDDYFGVANFPSACARLCLEAMEGRKKGKALDLGCAVGRGTFELAKGFDFVTGLDFSARFIRLGIELQERGEVTYQLKGEGELHTNKTVTLEGLGLAGPAKKVEFFQADACNLKPLWSGYDLIFAGNLIDRLYDPAKLLSTVHKRLNDRGLLILASPYTWLEEYTPKESWVGGLEKEGKPFTTLEGLKEMLGPRFTMIGEPRDLEFVIRETPRKFQHTVSQVTVWEKK